MSYSEVSKHFQHDEMKAIKALMEIAEAQQNCLRKIKELEVQLKSENQDYNNRILNIEHICTHIKKQPPFMIVQDGKAYQFSETYQVHVSEVDYLLPPNCNTTSRSIDQEGDSNH